MEVISLSKSYGDELIFDNFNIKFKEGKVNCILGPSGCGKSTLLNILSGNISFEQGTIKGIGDKEISYVFQEDALLPWKTVYENIQLVLKSIYHKERIREITFEYLKLVGLEEHYNYYPQKLSGGMKQRVNIIRALAYPSEVIIMDEPFKSLDRKNKFQIMKDIKPILDKEKRTVIFVTHDIEEAIELGEEIFVLGKRPATIINKLEKELYEEEVLRKEILNSLYIKE